MEGLLPPAALDALTPEQLRAVQEALDEYRRYADARVSGVLYSQGGGGPAREQLKEITKSARDGIEQTLRTAIRDDVVVGQLTTAVLRFG